MQVVGRVGGGVRVDASWSVHDPCECCRYASNLNGNAIRPLIILPHFLL
jgi:hypothetical protein